MKRRFVPTIIATLLYLILFWFYYQDEAASDGFTEIGFPFYFYTNSGGKFFPGYQPAFGFNGLNSLLDLVALFLIILVANFIHAVCEKKRFKKKLILALPQVSNLWLSCGKFLIIIHTTMSYAGLKLC